jgi:hypothetical protein
MHTFRKTNHRTAKGTEEKATKHEKNKLKAKLFFRPHITSINPHFSDNNSSHTKRHSSKKTKRKQTNDELKARHFQTTKETNRKQNLCRSAQTANSKQDFFFFFSFFLFFFHQ